MPQIIIPLAVIAGLLVAIIGAGFFIKYKLRGVSRSVFGTDDFMEGYREQKRKLSETPRSVHSMTNIYLPEIQRDFPEFDYEHFRTGAQAVLRGYLNAVSTGSTATMPNDITNKLRNNVTEIIENLLKEVDRLKKYEQAIDQILKPDADEMMGREAGKK